MNVAKCASSIALELLPISARSQSRWKYCSPAKRQELHANLLANHAAYQADSAICDQSKQLHELQQGQCSQMQQYTSQDGEDDPDLSTCIRIVLRQSSGVVLHVYTCWVSHLASSYMYTLVGSVIWRRPTCIHLLGQSRREAQSNTTQ